MTSNKKIVALITCLFIIIAKGITQTQPPQMEWNVISKDDIKMTEWEADTTAGAVVLGHVGSLYMTEIGDYLGFELRVHKRIKILKKGGFGEANVQIPFYTKDGYERIAFNRGQVIQNTGIKTAIDPKSVIFEKYNDRWSVLKFTFPEVKEGCIIEYEYKLESKNLVELHEWKFQEEIPTRSSVLKLDINSQFEYVYLFQGKDNIQATEPKYVTSKSSATAFQMADKDRTQVSFFANHLPGLREEAFVSSLTNYNTRVRFQLSKRYLPTGGSAKILTDWQQTETQLLDSDSFGKLFLKESSFDKVSKKVKPLYNETDSAITKIQKIYDWINQSLSWNGNYSIGAGRSGDELLKNPEGSSGEINLLLVGLLREAGIEAHPVILSTRSHEKVYKDFPILDQFNHVIVYAEKENGQSVLLDAGSTLRPIGMVRIEALNDEGWLVQKKKSRWIPITPSVSNKSALVNVTLDENGDCKGSFKWQFKGYDALKERSRLVDTKDKTISEQLHKKTEWAIDSADTENFDKVDLPLKETIHFQISQAAESNGSFMYFKPTLQFDWDTNPFKSPKRYYPIEFPYPQIDRMTTIIKLPAGYKVEEIPKPLTLNFQGGEATFTYSISQTDNALTLNTQVQIKKLVFIPDAYVPLRDFFTQIASKLEEPIVLKRISQ